MARPKKGSQNAPAATDATKTEAPTASINIGLIFCGLLVFRLINALTIKTFFQPDEYFQSLEPALETAFGPSVNAWITWEWHERLRSSIHPLLFASVYSFADTIAATLNLSQHARAEVLIAAPKVLQAVFAALTDAYTYRLACDVYGTNDPAAFATYVLTVCSPWQWFASVRTLSNSLETTLTVIALRLWPWGMFFVSADKESSRAKTTSTQHYISLCAAALACILRPTNLIIWATITAVLVVRHGGKQAMFNLAPMAFICGTAVLAVSIAADWAFYGELVLPPLRFLYFNVVRSLAVFYGKNRPDYYITEGLPLLLTTAVLFAVQAVWQALRAPSTSTTPSEVRKNGTRFALAMAVVTSVAILSLVSHKEVRFIYPLLPILHVLAAAPVGEKFFGARASRNRFALFAVGIAIDIAIIYYTGYVHKRGVIDVMHYLRHEHEKKLASASSSFGAGVVTTTVAFLMPCHSTPWRSHLIYPEIDAGALSCEPPLHLAVDEREGYMDEADVFYADPVAWIGENMASTETIRKGTHLDNVSSEKKDWPEYLAFFEQLEPTIEQVLGDTRYHECWRGFNTHWHDDSRRKGDVIVWCLE
ncbi:glycosylphosphatidylinositol anchor biosynthesis [Extremus antarcticus]|uniref:Mannosyltransferase n=1 Tax=Extremus antarcticus TaxID=702011 RepID=A0AAJ0D7S5_9PEZI|nr:glycosylphosphatidylinositol anchor biosynthesis [Extremus antarcticus]